MPRIPFFANDDVFKEVQKETPSEMLVAPEPPPSSVSDAVVSSSEKVKTTTDSKIKSVQSASGSALASVRGKTASIANKATEVKNKTTGAISNKLSPVTTTVTNIGSTGASLLNASVTGILSAREKLEKLCPDTNPWGDGYYDGNNLASMMRLLQAAFGLNDAYLASMMRNCINAMMRKAKTFATGSLIGLRDKGMNAAAGGDPLMLAAMSGIMNASNAYIDRNVASRVVIQQSSRYPSYNKYAASKLIASKLNEPSNNRAYAAAGSTTTRIAIVDGQSAPVPGMIVSDGKKAFANNTKIVSVDPAPDVDEFGNPVWVCTLNQPAIADKSIVNGLTGESSTPNMYVGWPGEGMGNRLDSMTTKTFVGEHQTVSPQITDAKTISTMASNGTQNLVAMNVMERDPDKIAMAAAIGRKMNSTTVVPSSIPSLMAIA